MGPRITRDPGKKKKVCVSEPRKLTGKGNFQNSCTLVQSLMRTNDYFLRVKLCFRVTFKLRGIMSHFEGTPN